MSVFWVVTPCGPVDINVPEEEKRSEDEDSMFLRKAGMYSLCNRNQALDIF
jgi:hypothetical protein